MRKGMNTGGGVMGGLLIAAFIFAAIGALCSLVDKPSNPAPAIGIGLGVAHMSSIFGLFIRALFANWVSWVVIGILALAIFGWVFG